MSLFTFAKSVYSSIIDLFDIGLCVSGLLLTIFTPIWYRIFPQRGNVSPVTRKAARSAIASTNRRGADIDRIEQLIRPYASIYSFDCILVWRWLYSAMGTYRSPRTLACPLSDNLSMATTKGEHAIRNPSMSRVKDEKCKPISLVQRRSFD